MFHSNQFRRFLPFLLSFMICAELKAQTIDENSYQHKMQLMDSLSIYKMSDYDTLYRISVLYNTHSEKYTDYKFGWCKDRYAKTILFVNIKGTEDDIEKGHITKIERLPINDATIDAIVDSDKTIGRGFGDFAGNSLLSLWLWKRGRSGYSKQLLPQNNKYFNDDQIRDNFGIIYYDAMLVAFSNERDYPKAIKFGKQLSKKAFNGYQYQKTAIALTAQLQNNPQDFKTYRLPDSVEWNTMEQKLSREQQIIYLADRLRLLNCIQMAQPGGINYDMNQFSISIEAANKLDIQYWGSNPKYSVINPFVELINMNLNPKETELLLPYLLSDDYIASYNYFRDFMPTRNLHKLSWVIHTLVYQITNQTFITQKDFDALTLDEKKTEVEKIRKWCDDNAGLSREEMTVKILKTSDKWIDFHKAMMVAKKEKYPELLPLIIDRFNDFKADQTQGFPMVFQPSQQGLMAETMFDNGGDKYVSAVKNWSRDTTDLWVDLFTSLYLLKYDKGSYAFAMNRLETVLQQGDATTYYPYAMDQLLNMNDARALKLAEGMLTKPQFDWSLSSDYTLNFIKKLLLLKSDYTFNFISNKIEAFTPEEIAQFGQNNNSTNVMMPTDFYVIAVEKLKSTKPGGYFMTKSIEEKTAYRKTLNNWFKAQYGLLKIGKPNELLLNTVPDERPVTFLDAPSY